MRASLANPVTFHPARPRITPFAIFPAIDGSQFVKIAPGQYDGWKNSAIGECGFRILAWRPQLRIGGSADSVLEAAPAASSARMRFQALAATHGCMGARSQITRVNLPKIRGNPALPAGSVVPGARPVTNRVAFVVPVGAQRQPPKANYLSPGEAAIFTYVKVTIGARAVSKLTLTAEACACGAPKALRWITLLSRSLRGMWPLMPKTSAC